MHIHVCMCMYMYLCMCGGVCTCMHLCGSQNHFRCCSWLSPTPFETRYLTKPGVYQLGEARWSVSPGTFTCFHLSSEGIRSVPSCLFSFYVDSKDQMLVFVLIRQIFYGLSYHPTLCCMLLIELTQLCYQVPVAGVRIISGAKTWLIWRL